MKFNSDISERILNYLCKNIFGSITDVSIGARTTRITAKKHLERLAKEGFIEEKKMGIFRVFYIKKKDRY